jgi:hypothetical protein
MERGMWRGGVLALCWLAAWPVGLAVGKSQTGDGPSTSARRAIVVDERFSALWEKPGWEGKLRRRLRRGRVVWLIGAPRIRQGERFHRVAVSRRTRGWIHEAALVRPGERTDGERLWRVIEETEDDFVKVSLAQLCALHFRGQPVAARALWLLGETMTRVAHRLTLEAERRIGKIDPIRHRSAMMGYVSLDRYNRLGISFLYDGASGTLRYDGAAFDELRQRYPRSAEAQRSPLSPLPGRE